ncbi:hypothetical protein CMUS01_03472 [Colletotrichum musicola]|uniref:Uncharacterized protein n=1 Tax=Colletotrichum musicola TaxID=2175873 RepID=A0A8H6NSS2_9PEZI|nr:hypothetical protein CMUS01_03472 [Colletotrichum musicola]
MDPNAGEWRITTLTEADDGPHLESQLDHGECQDLSCGRIEPQLDTAPPQSGPGIMTVTEGGTGGMPAGVVRTAQEDIVGVSGPMSIGRMEDPVRRNLLVGRRRHRRVCWPVRHEIWREGRSTRSSGLETRTQDAGCADVWQASAVRHWQPRIATKLAVLNARSKAYNNGLLAFRTKRRTNAASPLATHLSWVYTEAEDRRRLGKRGGEKEDP